MKTKQNLLMIIFAMILSFGMSLNVFAGTDKGVSKTINTTTSLIATYNASGGDVVIQNSSGGRINFTVYSGNRYLGSKTLSDSIPEGNFGKGTAGEKIYIYAGSLESFSFKALLTIKY